MHTRAIRHQRAATPTSLPLPFSQPYLPHHRSAFTLIELLVVMAIIAVLAGLGFAGITGALNTARKAEVRAMANQIKLGITSYYAEYGTYPSNQRTDAAFLTMMTGGTNGNRRGIRFLEVPGKFTNSSGLVTPNKFYGADQSNFVIIADTNYDGRIRLPGQSQDSGGNVAVYVTDPASPTKYIGTW
jgi:prepilin-type N-terminal cleavage/methylation domain-containing protein